MAITIDLNPVPQRKAASEAARPGHLPADSRKRVWAFFTDDQMRRFESAKKKKGLKGSPLLCMIFNEWADRNGV